MPEQLSGIIIVDKEKGYTSFDVVACLRKIFHIKKIGHTGTLDPDATGVLVCCIGRATKLIPEMENSSKEYMAGMRLGLVTDTQDIWGQVESESDIGLTSEEQVRQALLGMQGDIMQTPPMYSAKKINGKKLYELAREGQVIERKAVAVRINEIRDITVELPRTDFTADVSKGTYIRTLIHDVGAKLGCGACMDSLRRTRAGKYGIGQAHTLEEIREIYDAGKIADIMITVEDFYEDLPKATVRLEAYKLLVNGNRLGDDAFTPDSEYSGCDRIRVHGPDGTFAAVYRRDDGVFKPDKMFVE